MRFSIQQKLFILLAGLSTAVLLGVLYSISQKLEAEILKKVASDSRQTQRNFAKEQTLRYDRLIESATLIGENSTFKGNVQVNDPGTVNHIVEEFSEFAKFDLFIVTDGHGRVLARLGDPDMYGDDLTYRPSVQRALRGEFRDEVEEMPELWAVDDELYQVATVPIYLTDTIIGTITAGSMMADYEAQQLKGSASIDLSFVSDRRLIGSSIDTLTQGNIENFMEKHRVGVSAVLSELTSSDPFETELGGRPVFAFISPLGIGEAAFFVASVPKDYELNILHLLQRNIYLTAAISLAITVLLALVLGRTLSRPILRLVEGMNVVRGGDLSVEVEATTRDEVGLLTDAFNQMLVGLRERLQLMKYVGSHTRDMISKASGSDVALGGSRQELAVLFTDIRGFTAFSEKRTPEEVIDKVNRYLGFQAEIVPDYEGSIDKFVGDEMVALFFGDQAVERAIRCSVEIQRRVKEEHKTDPVPIDIGIGINYGPVILGNMGAENRLDYTVIGSEVNLGARLCAAAAGGEILIRKELIEGSNLPFEIAAVKKMSFKGVSQELEIAALAGDTP